MLDAALPADVQTALDANPHAKQAFEKLPASHKREYLQWVLDAKKPDTRARRIGGMLERLTAASA